MKTILVTGGCGYIGSHTIVDLLQIGYRVISADNNSRSDERVLAGVRAITGVSVKNYKVDLCVFEDTAAVFRENPEISGIIHFAAFKAVGESVEKPLLYFQNNLGSLINVLRCAAESGIKYFVFSSSCTVYGNPDHLPVTENAPLKPAVSPYGCTKQMSEEILLQTLCGASGMKGSLLRYFNPVGAHPSGEIGELPIGTPQNLVPAITQTAIGKQPQLMVWGHDYATKDGTCVRDYIHVCDIARAHTLALQRMELNDTPLAEIFNLGSGTGNTVLEMIRTFERVAGIPLNYELAERRAGDAEAVYADNRKALELLGWQPQFDSADMLRTAWLWEKKLADNLAFSSLEKPGLN